MVSGSRSRGFTLIELLMVVSLIGILAVIGIGQYGAYRMKGYNAAAITDLGLFKSAMEIFYTENHIYP